MATQSKKQVPVTSREITGAKKPRTFRMPALPRLSLGEVLVMLVVAILTLGVIYAPLHNYFEQRAEIARISASNEVKAKKVEALKEEIERYSDEAYVEEQARRRLGVIPEGTRAFRIIDPGMTGSGTVEKRTKDEEAPQAWYEVLWDSVTLAPEDEDKDAKPEMKLPVEKPEEAPQEAPAEVPQEAPQEQPAEAPAEAPQEAPADAPQEEPQP